MSSTKCNEDQTMMTISAYGRLGVDPTLRTTQSGKSMTTARIAVSLPDGRAEQGTFWIKVIAFGRQAEALASLSKGDIVSVMGKAQLSSWTDREGTARQDLQVVVDSIQFAEKSRKPKKEPEPKPDDIPFDDDLPF
jgi:single-strand DNA-binding protein